MHYESPLCHEDASLHDVSWKKKVLGDEGKTHFFFFWENYTCIEDSIRIQVYTETCVQVWSSELWHHLFIRGYRRFGRTFCLNFLDEWWSCSSETAVSSDETARCHNPEDHKLSTRQRVLIHWDDQDANCTYRFAEIWPGTVLQA